MRRFVRLLCVGLFLLFAGDSVALAQQPDFTRSQNDRNYVPASLADVSAEAQLRVNVVAASRRNVLVQRPDGACTGVVVERGQVLTAGHCYDATKQILVNGSPAKLIKLGVGVDLALLAAETEKLSRVVLNTDPSVIERVFAIFNVGQRRGVIQFGRVNFLTDEDLDTGINGAPGISGGGVYSYDGRLVGLAVAMFGVGNREEKFVVGTSLVPAKKIRAFMGQ